MTAEEQTKNSLIVHTLMDVHALRLPADATRDSRKLTKFLEDVEKTVNKTLHRVLDKKSLYSSTSSPPLYIIF